MPSLTSTRTLSNRFATKCAKMTPSNQPCTSGRRGSCIEGKHPRKSWKPMRSRRAKPTTMAGTVTVERKPAKTRVIAIWVTTNKHQNKASVKPNWRPNMRLSWRDQKQMSTFCTTALRTRESSSRLSLPRSTCLQNSSERSSRSSTAILRMSSVQQIAS